MVETPYKLGQECIAKKDIGYGETDIPVTVIRVYPEPAQDTVSVWVETKDGFKFLVGLDKLRPAK